MPSAKSGTAGTADSPGDPLQAKEALDDNPGDSATTSSNPAQTQADTWDQVKVTDEQPDEEKTDSTWIGIELKDAHGRPMPGQPFQVKTSDGTIMGGSLDGDGRARVEGVTRGQCEVRFPRLHNSEWQKA